MSSADAEEKQNHEVGVFTNSSGQTYTVRGLSPMLPERIALAAEKAWLKEHAKLPECPTYQIETLGGQGEPVTQPLSEKLLVVEGDLVETQKRQDQWREYSLNKAKLDADKSMRMMRAVFMAVDVSRERLDKWRKSMEFIGADLPDVGTPEEAYQYVETEVVQTPADLAGLMVAVFRAAGIINKETAETAEATFRTFVESAVNSAIEKQTSEGALEGE